MRAVYRTSFELRHLPSDSADLFESFADTVWSWIYGHSRQGVPPRPAAAVGAVTLAPQRTPDCEIESMAVEGEGHKAWGVVFTHGERDNPDLLWRSELSLAQDSGRHYFCFSQLVGYRDGGLVPLQRLPGRPRIIRTLVGRFGAYSGGLRLVEKPTLIGSEPKVIEKIVQILESSQRTHPVVFVSIHKQSGKPTIDIADLADRLSGLAHVIVAKNQEADTAFSSMLPEWLGCSDGAIRLYWPRFRRSHQAFHHPLWTVQDLSELFNFNSRRFEAHILAQIANVSVCSAPSYFHTWERIQGMDRRRVIAAAKDNKDWQSLALGLDKESQAQAAEIAGLKAERQALSEELFNERQLTAKLLQAVKDFKAGRSEAAQEQLPVQSVAEAIERATARFSERIVFALNGRSEKDSPYDAPAEVFLAFEWLATVYHDSKTNTRNCADLDRHFREAIAGWRYSAHQKEATMKANEEWYRSNLYLGAKHWIPEHLKSGNSRSAEEAIRIAFTWHEPTKKVVVGFIGQHQKSALTN